MKAVLLARVSTEEQKEAGNSLPAQMHRLEEYCQRKGYAIAKKFSFDESAYKLKRDEFDKAIDYIKESNEKLVVCFDKVDRLTRNVFDKRIPLLYELAMSDKIELHFTSESLAITPNISAVEKFHFGISLNLAKYFSDAISDNTRRGNEAILRRGEWIGQCRIGYMAVYANGNGKRDFVLDQEKAGLIRTMYELYATNNFSVKTLRTEITKMGLRSTHNKVLSPSMIHKILTDKFYIGIMTSKGKEYPHRYPTIVPKRLFDDVQGILASYDKKHVQYAVKPFALRGLVRCDKCDGLITPELKKGRYVYYSCANFKGTCERKWIREEKLLEPIKEVLANIQMPQERVDQVVARIKETSESKNTFHTKAVNQLQAEYASTQQKLNRLLDLLIDNSITRDEYDAKLKEYKEKQYDIGIRLEEYTKADENFHLVASMIFSVANRALEIFESSEVPEKRQFLNYLLQNCKLSGTKLRFELKEPFRSILETRHEPTLLPLQNRLGTLDWTRIKESLALLRVPQFVQY